jgi:membrane protein YqaA with SNARE-associated domain
LKRTLSTAWQRVRDFVASAHGRLSRQIEEHRRWRWLLLTLVIIVVFGVSYAILHFSSQLDFLKSYSYLGAFLASLITTTSIIFPIPGFVIVGAIAAATANWPLVALASALGNGLGETTSYFAGYGGSAIIHPQKSRFYQKAEEWMQRHGSLTIFIFALTPLPFDVVGIAAGALRFPLWKVILAVIAGRLPLTMAGCYLAHKGWKEWPQVWDSLKSMAWWEWTLIVAGILIIILCSVVLWRLRRGSRQGDDGGD